MAFAQNLPSRQENVLQLYFFYLGTVSTLPTHFAGTYVRGSAVTLVVDTGWVTDGHGAQGALVTPAGEADDGPVLGADVIVSILVYERESQFKGPFYVG